MLVKTPRPSSPILLRALTPIACGTSHAFPSDTAPRKFSLPVYQILHQMVRSSCGFRLFSLPISILHAPTCPFFSIDVSAKYDRARQEFQFVCKTEAEFDCSYSCTARIAMGLGAALDQKQMIRPTEFEPGRFVGLLSRRSREFEVVRHTEAESGLCC